jgi:hypothetical protein
MELGSKVLAFVMVVAPLVMVSGVIAMAWLMKEDTRIARKRELRLEIEAWMVKLRAMSNTPARQQLALQVHRKYFTSDGKLRMECQ